MFIDNRYFQVEIKELHYRKKTSIGFLIEFIDRTAEGLYLKAIEDYNSRLEKEVEHKTNHITQIKDSLLLGLAEMVESRDRNTGGILKEQVKLLKFLLVNL